MRGQRQRKGGKTAQERMIGQRERKIERAESGEGKRLKELSNKSVKHQFYPVCHT